jgi:hypothetical protein
MIRKTVGKKHEQWQRSKHQQWQVKNANSLIVMEFLNCRFRRNENIDRSSQNFY